MKYILLWCCLIAFTSQSASFTCMAQGPVVKRERIFTGSGLYGFMNGGADQFLEYGVERLVARDILYEGEEYSIEIYEMPTPQDAFGIYSLHTFRCQRADTAGCVDCLSPYQLQAVAGNTYVSVVFPSGSNAAKKAVDAVVRQYVPLLPGNNPLIPSVLKTEYPYSGHLKYLRGPISVSGASASLAGLVDGIAYTGIWFEQERRSRSYQALIYCPAPVDIQQLKAKLSSSDIIEAGADYLYIYGKEKEETKEDVGNFGF